MSKIFKNLADITRIQMPAATRTWQPVSQVQLFNSMCDAIRDRGFTITSESHRVHHKKPVFISQVEIEAPGLPGGKEMRWNIAGMQSWNKTVPVKLLFGGTVLVCTNGMVVAEHILKTKHTTNVWSRLDPMIEQTVDLFESQVNRTFGFYQQMKDVRGTHTTLCDFAVRVAAKDYLPKTQILDLVQEAENPSFDYGTNAGSVYNIHAAFTHLLKTANPLEAPSRLLGFERELKDHYELAAV
jgi:hypothetical protein